MLKIKSSRKKVVPPEYSNIWWLKIITGVFLLSFVLLSGYVIWITYYSTFRIAEYGIDVISLEQAQVEPINFKALEKSKTIDANKKSLTPPLISRNVFFNFSKPQSFVPDENERPEIIEDDNSLIENDTETTPLLDNDSVVE